MQKLIIHLLTLFFLQESLADNIRVGITQFVSHPTLDIVRSGVLKGLDESGFKEGSNLQVKYKNSNGNIALASQIAKQFSSEKFDVIIAITTPSAQTAKKALKNKTPLIFSTVTDPVAAGLITNPDSPTVNVTGTTNPVALKKQLKYMLDICPDIKTLGVIVNFSEDNSVSLLKALKDESKPLGIKVAVASVGNSSEVSMAAKSLVGKVDAAFLLQDNTVASALSSALKVYQKNRVPVFSSYVDAVEKGALAGLAFDEYDIGLQTGRLAAKVINQASAKGVAVEIPRKIDKVINMKTLRQLKIEVSKDVMLSSKIIN